MMSITAAWDAAGRPVANWQGKATTTRAAPPPRDGVCALTGTRGPVVDGRHVVSATYTGWDRLRWRHADPAGLGFGAPAAWALRHRLAMQRTCVLTAGRWTQDAAAPVLYDALTGLSDRPATLVSVPISGQKHVLPWAAWGHVRTDDHLLPWAAADSARLGTYRALRLLGYGEAALTEASPRWHLLSRATRDDQRWALLRWQELDPWRATPIYMDVAARATRTPKEAPDAGAGMAG